MIHQMRLLSNNQDRYQRSKVTIYLLIVHSCAALSSSQPLIAPSSDFPSLLFYPPPFPLPLSRTTSTIAIPSTSPSPSSVPALRMIKDKQSSFRTPKRKQRVFQLHWFQSDATISIFLTLLTIVVQFIAILYTLYSFYTIFDYQNFLYQKEYLFC